MRKLTIFLLAMMPALAQAEDWTIDPTKIGLALDNAHTAGWCHGFDQLSEFANKSSAPGAPEFLLGFLIFMAIESDSTEQEILDLCERAINLNIEMMEIFDD